MSEKVAVGEPLRAPVTAPRTISTSVSVAPYALVRMTSVPYPAQSPQSASFREAMRRLVALEAGLADLKPVLCDALYVSRKEHGEAFHRTVVLPLRRAVHNGREPASGLLERLEDLPYRVPELQTWLDDRAHRKLVAERATDLAPSALADERQALAALCAHPALLHAVALTSADLLRAVQRASRVDDQTATPDRRGRKAEPGVLRYTLRASTKTSPLTWFVTVGWGRHDDERPATRWTRELDPDPAQADRSAATVPNHALTETLLDALLSDPRRSRSLRYRLSSEPRLTTTRATFLRNRQQLSAGRFLVAGEDEVEVARGGPLDFVIGRARNPVLLDDLVGDLVDGICAPSKSGQRKASAKVRAEAFIRRLVDERLLAPCSPVDPQEPDPLPRLAAWLREPQDAADADGHLAEQLEAISAATRAFADTAPELRQRALYELSARWNAVFAEIQRPAPSAPVLTEDLVTRAPVPVGGLLGADDRAALAEFAPFAERFDVGHAVRDLLRDRFVARYGLGGTCPRPWEFAPEVRRAWQDVDTPVTGPEGGEWREEVFLDEDQVREAGTAGRLGPRPVSYSFFVQRDDDSGLLCVNHVYGGWGRFTSRFLSALGPSAAADVTRQIHDGLGPAARPVQIRPVGGFNANLHPRLVPDELGDDPRRASLTERDVELIHDPATDQVRFRLRNGRLLDVLYSGFLAPVMLPDRVAVFVNDFPSGVVNFAPLVPRFTVETPAGQLIRTPRLRYRHLVLRRRRWHLPGATQSALREEIAADGEVPIGAVARWRSLLDLPEQVFLHPLPPPSVDRTSQGLLRALELPKPHLADLGNALHLRCLGKWLARHGDGVVFEEALPAAGGRTLPHRAVELVVETYRSGELRSGSMRLGA
jgi:hypothetical protein